MRLYSKANLEVAKVVSQNPVDGALTGVHLAADGATVSGNGRTFMVVAPVDGEKVPFPFVGEEVNLPAMGVTIEKEIADTAYKNIPRQGKTPTYQHVALTRCDDAKVELTATDGRKEQRVGAPALDVEYPDYKAVLRNVERSAKVGRVCVSRKHLLTILEAMDKASSSASGEVDELLYIDFGKETDAMLLRSENFITGQRIIGVAAPMNTKGNWLEYDRWENTVFGKLVKTIKKIIKQLNQHVTKG